MGFLNFTPMKISWNWLKELLPVTIDVYVAADILTDIGLEVEGIYPYESIKGGLEGLITGEVISVEKHPDADKLQITQVNTGDQILQIVCGAPNVAAGQKVIVATAGTTIYPIKSEPFSIKKTKIRGIESNGMLCAEDEIALGPGHDGLYILPAEAQVGVPVNKLLEVYKDTIIEIGLTANHADAFSHYGVARELHAALICREIEHVELNKNLFKPVIKPVNKEGQIQVVIENTEACRRYSGILIQNITVEESPAWLKNKLIAVGMRPINNVVDITNYVLNESGQPLHAFDADKIQNHIIRVKTVDEGTLFKTLDEKERKLSGDDLMICDDVSPLVIAGVFGGVNSGVTNQTKNIFLESAHFNSLWIRRTEARHNLKTDASSRFGKGTDPEITVSALNRCVQLLIEIAGGESGEVIDIYPVKVQPSEIFLRYQRLRLFTDIDIPAAIVKKILTSLNITIIADKDDGLLLHVPPYKNDVTREVDIIEEVLRIYGYNRIPIPEIVKTPFSLSARPDREKIKLDAGKYLSAQGYFEIFTNPISMSKYIDTWTEADKNKTIRLLNSLSSDLDCMRQTMLFTGLEVIEYNSNRKQQNLKLFEFGKKYELINGRYIETEQIAIFLTGTKSQENWKQKSESVDLFDLKTIIHLTAKRMNAIITEKNIDNELLQQAIQVTSTKQAIGIYGLIKTDITKSFGIKQPVYYAELNWYILQEMSGVRKTEFIEIPRFPDVRRDLSLILDSSVTYQQIKDIALNDGNNLLNDVILFDVYQDVNLIGKKSYAIGLMFSDDNKTLTDLEVDAIIHNLIHRYENDLNAVIRK